MADLEEKEIATNPLITKARLLAAGGVIAIAATIGTQVDVTPKPEPVPVTVEIALAVKGAEIKALRTANSETFKADSAWVHPKDAQGKSVKADSFKVAAFTARVYAAPKYFMDADGDTLRALDLTVREISALAKLNPLKTHDRYVDAGPYTAQWMDAKPGEFRMDAGTAYVKYRALFDAETSIEATADGMKELVTLADSTAAHTLRWVVDTDGSLVANAAGGFDVQAKDGTVPMRIERPRAWDAGGKPVMASATVAGDTLTFRVTMLPGQEYPVTVDPTTTATVGSSLAGHTYSDKSGSYLSSVYADAKDETVGSVSYTGGLTVGQYAYGGEGCTTPGCPRVMIYRSFIALPGAMAGMATVSACTLFVDGAGDNTATDFDMKMYGARAAKSTITTADFSRFHGWSTSYLGGTNLIESWSTSSYSSGWNKFILNSAGRDSLRAASGDTLWVALISSRDTNYQTPTLNTLEHIEFTGSGGSAPYWSYTYTLAYANPPTGYTLHTPAATGMKASWTNRHSPAVDSLGRFTGAGAWAGTLAKADTSETISGLSPNTRYIYKVKVDSVTYEGYSNADTLYTLAAAPTNLAITLTDSTIGTLTFDTNSNPAGTTYALRDSSTLKWAGFDGVFDSTAAAWRTEAAWEATSLNLVANLQGHIIGIVGKNSDNIWTAYDTTYVTTGILHSVNIASLSSGGATHVGGGIYTIERGEINPANLGTGNNLGQEKNGGFYGIYRWGLNFVIPRMDTVLTDSLIINASADQSETDFNFALAGSDTIPGIGVTAQFFAFGGHPPATADSSAYSITNLLDAFSTSGYAARMPVKISSSGRTWLMNAVQDTASATLLSSRDVSSTVPSGLEYITISSVTLKLHYAVYDALPTNVVVTAESDTSIIVTWTSNSETASYFQLVDSLGVALGGSDTTSSNIGNKTYRGCIPNKTYHVYIKVIGGMLNGQISTSSDYARTWARTPVPPTVTAIGTAYRKVVIDTTGAKNPGSTLYAVQDSALGKFIVYLAGVCSLRTGTTDSSWVWKTYAQTGGSLGATVLYPPGKTSRFRIYTKNSQ